MQSNFAAAIALVLKSEGGYVDNPKDNGGATNLGITRAVLASWRGVAPVTRLPKSAVANLTVAEATTIYRANYWQAIAGDDLPSGLDYAVLDYAVNSAPARAAKALQTLLGVTVDGRIGPETVAAAKAAGNEAILKLCAARLAWLETLPTWQTFGGGWSKRVASVRADALNMAAGAQLPVPAAVQPVAYLQPAPIAATRGAVKDGLIAAGSTTLQTTDTIKKAVLGIGGITGITEFAAQFSELGRTLAAVPWFVWLAGFLGGLGALWWLTHRIESARILTAITGVNTEVPMVRPPVPAAAQPVAGAMLPAVVAQPAPEAAPEAAPAAPQAAIDADGEMQEQVELAPTAAAAGA
jgi:lysozyme family protein